MSESKCQLVAADGSAVPLVGFKLSASIVGLCCRVFVNQIFENSSSSPLEASFTFSLSGTTVCGFTADYAGHHLEASVKSRDRAFSHFDDAVSAGATAFLAEQSQETEGAVTVSIGNLPPRESCTITVEYIQALASDGGLTRFSVPFTASTPRCAATVEVTAIPSGSKIIRVASSSHPQGTSEVSADGKSSVYRLKSTADEGFGGIPFALEIQEESPFDPALVIEDDPETNDVAVMLTFTPSIPGQAVATVPEFIFVVDCSGSMSGGRIERAKLALKMCLRGLPARCLFNSSLFPPDLPSSLTISLRQSSALGRVSNLSFPRTSSTLPKSEGKTILLVSCFFQF